MLSWLSHSSTFYCRETRLPDALALARLHGEGFERQWSASEFESMLGSAGIIGHIAEASPLQARGFILSRRAADEAEILSLIVARNARRHGIGSALIARHLSALAGFGVKNLFLEVEEENQAALALYRQYGFEAVGKRNSYYKRADGSSPAALILKRLLN